MSISTDLTALARAVRWPPVDPQDAAREALAASGRGVRYGRLAELAAWWASVRDDPSAGPPARVAAIGLGSPVPDPAGIEVRRIAWPSPMAAGDAVGWGVSAADRLVDEGVELLLLAADDPARPIARKVLAAQLLGVDAVEALGWPVAEDGSRDPAIVGVVDDAHWMDEVVALRDGLRAVRPVADDVPALLEAVGSRVLAGAAGLLLAAAARRTPTVLDGPGAATAGLLVRSLAWETPDWWQIPAHTPETLHERVVSTLRMAPLPGPSLAVEDGTAALLATDLLRAAVALLPGSAGDVEQAEPAE